MSFTIDERDTRDGIIWKLHQLKEGQCIKIECRVIEEKFPVFMTEWDTPRERLLSNLMGSGYGGFTVEQIRDPSVPMSWQSYTICRHECGEKRVYVDPDRRGYYDLKPDGTYELRKATK